MTPDQDSSDTDRDSSVIILPIIVSLSTAAILGFILLCANACCQCGRHRHKLQEEEDEEEEEDRKGEQEDDKQDVEKRVDKQSVEEHNWDF